MLSGNFGVMCHQNNNMAKEYYGLLEKHKNVNQIVHSVKLVEYHREKESSLYSALFVIGYLAFACQWNIITIFRSVVFMLYKRLPL